MTIDTSLRRQIFVSYCKNHRDYDVEAMTAVSRRFFDTRGVAQPADSVHLL